MNQSRKWFRSRDNPCLIPYFIPMMNSQTLKYTHLHLLLEYLLQVIRPEAPAVAKGSIGKILIVASREGETYQLARDGKDLGPPLAGNGQDLAFETDPIVADTAFEVRVGRTEDPGIPVLQSVPVSVLTLPDATLEVSASAAEVDRGGTA